MRLRNLKNKEEIIKNSDYVVSHPERFVGKWDTLFGNSHPIYLEIGMGFGKFLLENALLYPDINFIGIEKNDNVLARSLKHFPDAISNLKIISLDALCIDQVFFKEIDRIYLNFSDPWPKKRQSKRRLTSEKFLDKYETIFRNQCEVYLRTDNPSFFIYSIESFSREHYILSDVTFDLHHDYPPRVTTEYEDKFSLRGLQIYALKARK